MARLSHAAKFAYRTLPRMLEFPRRTLLGSSVNRGDPLTRLGAPTRVVLNAVLSPCRSLWVQGAAGTSSAALKAFEGALKRSSLQSPERVPKVIVLLTPSMHDKPRGQNAVDAERTIRDSNPSCPSGTIPTLTSYSVLGGGGWTPIPARGRRYRKSLVCGRSNVGVKTCGTGQLRNRQSQR